MAMYGNRGREHQFVGRRRPQGLVGGSPWTLVTGPYPECEPDEGDEVLVVLDGVLVVHEKPAKVKKPKRRFPVGFARPVDDENEATK